MLIYKITNTINNKLYIGQSTRSLEERIKDYIDELNNRPDSRPIIRAMNKYGFENFVFEVIEDNILSKENMDEKERYYIQVFHSKVEQYGYNVENGGNGTGKHSEQTKRKISEAQKGELNHMWGKTGSQNHTSKPVIELTTGKRYESACLAAEALSLNFSHICAVCRGQRGSTGGYVFRYLDNQEKPIRPNNPAYIKFTKVREQVLSKYKYLL